MPAIFLSSWTVLRVLHVPESVAFVWAGALAQAAQIWCTLPVTVRRQRLTFGRARSAVSWAVAVLICVLSFQIWWSDPWLSQRLVSIYCGLYAAIMALGILGDHNAINQIAPESKDSNVPLDFRRHLLMLYAWVAIFVIATNETLMALDTTLGTRVITLSILPIALHCFFWIALQLTHPPLDENDA